VAITSPAAGARFQAGATIAVSASASDPDGTIAKVDFAANGQAIGSSDTSSPYTIDWGNVAAGSYTLTAAAQDNLGASTVSLAVSITVDPSIALPTLLIFTASTNHSTAVDSYRMEVFPADTSTAIRTENLGKPTPVDGDISVDVASLVQGLSSGTYFFTVTAIGAGGSAQSAPSPNFTR
jgi:hypothetical protein